jgi:hypothetical protein
LGDA